MEQVYQKQKNGELYQKLMKTTPIVGIYVRDEDAASLFVFVDFKCRTTTTMD